VPCSPGGSTGPGGGGRTPRTDGSPVRLADRILTIVSWTLFVTAVVVAIAVAI